MFFAQAIDNIGTGEENTTHVLLLHYSQSFSCVIQKSMRLGNEPALEPLHIYAKELFFDWELLWY